MEIILQVISWVGERGNEGKGAGIKKHNWQVQNRQGRLRIVYEMEKPKNLHTRPMDMNNGGETAGWNGAKGEKLG